MGHTCEEGSTPVAGPAQDITPQPTQPPGAAPRPDGAAAAASSGARARATRADAVRNRAALLAAARAVFRQHGLAAQMDDVAARAGLGVGTLYRHFPTKDALLEVMLLERHDRLLKEARAALHAEDSWEGFATFLWRLAELDAEDRAIADILLAARRRLALTPFYAELRALVNTLAARTQAAGQMRADVGGEDALLAVCTLAQAQRDGPDAEADRWQRLVRVILDGLRAR
jgi:AcrR family transcriptional regulator